MVKHNGVNIRPSARKPLHSSCKNCCLTYSLPLQERMGRYGVSANQSRNVEKTMMQASTSYDEGIDEPDNIQSKPLPIGKEILGNTHSAHGINFSTLLQKKKPIIDSDNDKVLSYSAPAILQLYSHCRDESDETDTPETSYLSSSEKFLDNVDYNEPQCTLESHTIQRRFDKNEEVNYKQNIKCWSFGICIIAFIVYNFLYSNKSNIYSDVDKNIFFNDVTTLGQKYKVTDDSILQIKSGIATIFERQDAGSFIFTYNSHNSNFDSRFFNNFMNELTSSTARFLRKSSNIQDPVIVDSPKLDMQVHSELIEKYREDVSKTGVMLVKDLDEVPSSLAMAFHYYCDEFHPLIKKSAIFFTLNMAKCSDQKASHASIEKCLAKKWTSIPKDNIVPLLTRVVGVIVNIYP